MWVRKKEVRGGEREKGMKKEENNKNSKSMSLIMG